ncbi:MAG: hypothetical protein ACOXZR_02425 [Bacilli bacterium]|jgi:hypothetical protein
MENLEFIAIFIAPIFGLLISNYKYNFQLKELFLNYLSLVVITNLLTNLILWIFKEYLVYSFTISFFIKYSLTNIILSIFLSFLIMVIKENTNITLKVKKNEKN